MFYIIIIIIMLVVVKQLYTLLKINCWILLYGNYTSIKLIKIFLKKNGESKW